MKAYLLYDGKDFNPKEQNALDTLQLSSDGEFPSLFSAMAGEDAFIYDTAKELMFAPLQTSEEVLYRQEILSDCMKNPGLIREMYALAKEAVEKKEGEYWGLNSQYVAFMLTTAIRLLQVYSEMLRELRILADGAAGFSSQGMRRLFATLHEELSDEYIKTIQKNLEELKFPDGMMFSAELGEINEGANYIIRRRPDSASYRLKWKMAPPMFVGLSSLTSYKNRAVMQMANTLNKAALHVLSFFEMLRHELAFYVGCLNLQDRLAANGYGVSIPKVKPLGEKGFCCKGLYDISLALMEGKEVVSNDIDALGKKLIVVTGANQGGKTTFLRSFTQAQIMMQCGMFVGSEAYAGSMTKGTYTHFKKEEDESMENGKLDEELSRMSDIVNRISPGALILFNESFSSTNEQEGSDIARQIVDALLEKDMWVVFVSHQYEFAQSYFEKGDPGTLMLRAERIEGGGRTFKIVPGEPLQTSFGEDLYVKIFG